MSNSPIIIIGGEPKSIFLEIFFKALKHKKYKSPIILICCEKILVTHMKKNNFNKKINQLNLKKINFRDLNNNSINLINVECKKLKKKFVTKLTNNYIAKCFDLAIKLVNKKHSYKIINGPISKKKFLNKKFLGITEYISDIFQVKKFGMLIYNKKLSVCTLTTHLPLKIVPKYITKKNIEDKVNLIDNFFIKRFKFRPKIGITGLNPHCESILKFDEDKKIIAPTIKNLKKKGYLTYGPFSADTIFLKQNRKKFNVILGMYHDQVLTPIKTLFEYDAINITMGLPLLRVTPDHGPNEKMINKNISNPISIIRALEFLDSN